MNSNVKFEYIDKEAFRMIAKNYLTAKVTNIPFDKLEYRQTKFGLYPEMLSYSKDGSIYGISTWIGSEEEDGYENEFIMFYNAVKKNNKPLLNNDIVEEFIIPKSKWIIFSIVDKQNKEKDCIGLLVTYRDKFIRENQYQYSMQIEIFYNPNGKEDIQTELWIPVKEK